MAGMKLFQPTDMHRLLKSDIDDLLKKHAEHLSQQEILAIAAQVVGMIIAYQTKMTVSSCMDIVIANIETGNQLAMDSLRLAPAAGSA